MPPGLINYTEYLPAAIFVICATVPQAHQVSDTIMSTNPTAQSKLALHQSFIH